MSNSSFIPYGKQYIDEMDIQAVLEVMKSDYLTTGPKVKEFEKAVAEYVGAKYAVSFSNGTAALHGACFAAGISDGDEVITTPMTFVASANCILYQGGKPVFADIDTNTYNIDPTQIRKKITNKTKAIIPVDYTGQPAELDEIYNIAKEHNLIVIEDAAHAIGARYNGRKIGSISDMTMFSFHPVKHITTGEGGIITTNNEKYYQKLIQFRTHGITREIDLMEENHGPWYYEMQFLGMNYRMTDIQAALGISQLNKLDFFIEKRKNIAQIYNEAFESISEIYTPYHMSNVQSSWHLYVIGLNRSKLSLSRKEIYEKLIERNIGVNVHYIPVHYHPYYKRLGFKKGDYPNTEKHYQSIITLPLFPTMTAGDINYVIDNVIDVVKNSSVK